MTSPRVIELPRRLEPVERDTFLVAAQVDAGRAAARAGKVVALRPRVAVGPRRPDSRPPLAA
ncbi:MAG TPA: hypothetical protein VG474_16470 [Solirubrobacteraceae bacterium]|nr:hypothetical protein [Solirubrobacteraceae bacterium]